MTTKQVFGTIQTLLASRMLPNACQCSYEQNLDKAIVLIKAMHEDNVQVIDKTRQLLLAQL